MNSKKGFTLVELMIVVAIIGILSAIALPRFADLIRRSNEGATRGNLSSLRSALSIYFSEAEGLYPNVLDHAAFVAVMVPRYMKEIPRANTAVAGIPPSNNVAIVAAAGAAPASVAQWGFRSAPGTIDVSGVPRTYGDLWVHTSDLDSRGTVWATY